MVFWNQEKLAGMCWCRLIYVGSDSRWKECDTSFESKFYAEKSYDKRYFKLVCWNFFILTYNLYWLKKSYVKSQTSRNLGLSHLKVVYQIFFSKCVYLFCIQAVAIWTYRHLQDMYGEIHLRLGSLVQKYSDRSLKF